MSSLEHYPFGLKKILLTCMVCLFMASLHAQTIIYVNKNSTAVNPIGTSWATAYSDLRQALLTTNTMSGAVQLWVAQGIYYPTTVTGGAARFTSFTIVRNNLGIYGGFQGNETSLSQRNPKLYVTRLSGNIGSSTLKTDNTYSVVKISGYVNNPVIIDGLTISDGYNNAGSSQGANQGGGIYISQYSSITLNNCIVENNFAASNGGGIYSENGTSLIQNSIIRNNKAAAGGGFCSFQPNEDKIYNCLFLNDTANSAGGGMYCNNGQINVANCTFSKNHSNPTSSPSLLHGSAFAFLYGSAGAAYRFNNCIIWNNTPFNNNQVAVNSFGRASYNLFQGAGFGTNTITGNPGFVNEALDNYAISSSCSPAVDAGTVLGLSSDLLGNPRVMGRTTDLGCYEFGLGSSVNVTTPVYCEGGSGVVTVATPLDIINTNILNTTLGVNINTTLSTATLPSGIFGVSILEDGCPSAYFLGNVTVASPPTLTFSGSLSNVTCRNGANGAINISSILGGFAGSSLRVNIGGANVTAPTTFTGLSAQNYTINLVDVTRGCTKSIPVTITQPGTGVAILTASSSRTSCFGGSDGRIFFTPTGGTAPYTFSVSGISVPTATVTGLTGGNKTITIRDAGGCVGTGSVTILQPDPILVNVLKTNHLNCGNLGSVILTATGGNFISSVSYSVFGINYNPTYSSNTISGLNAGAISILATDLLGCTGSITGVTLTTPSSISTTVSGTNNLCNGTSLASITVAGSGGTLPYEYKRNNGNYQSSPIFSNLPAGSNNIEVKDAQGCLIVKTIQLVDPTPILIQSSEQAPTCFGKMDGSFTITISGGTGNKNGTVAGISFVNTGSFTGFGSGNYIYTIKDANNCTVPYASFLASKSALTLTGTVNNITCFNANDGKLALTATGSNGSYTYRFNAGGFSSVNTIGGLSAGSISGVVRDLLGCTASITSNISGPSSLLTASISSVANILCKGQNSGNVVLIGSGGAGGYLFASNPGAFGSNNTIAGLSAGAQSFQVKDANNCTVNLNATLTEPTQALTIIASVSGQSSISVSAAGGTGGIQFSVNNGALQSNGEFTGLTPGNYTLKAVDANGCEATTSRTISPVSSLTTTDTEKFGVYPNPTSGNFVIKGAAGAKIQIYSVSGTLVRELDSISDEAKIVLKESGLYSIIIQNPMEIKRVNVVVE